MRVARTLIVPAALTLLALGGGSAAGVAAPAAVPAASAHATAHVLASGTTPGSGMYYHS
jgi:hypothetical protein